MRSFTGGFAVAAMCALLLGAAMQAPGVCAFEEFQKYSGGSTGGSPAPLAGSEGESAGITTTVTCQGTACTTSVSASGDECLSLNSQAADGSTPLALALPQAAIFQQALSDVGVADELDNTATNYGYNYTVFVPTDEAILAYFANSDLAAPGDSFFNDNKDLTTQVLAYHVVNGAYYSDELESGDVLETRLTDGNTPKPREHFNLTVVDNGDGLTIAGDETQANIVVADIPICHGVVHLIDNVLVFKTLASEISDADNGNK